MDKKPKARSLAKRATKAPKKEKTQRERFIEAARDIGIDETGNEFEEALVKIARPAKRISR